jgi:hypothetical protein
VAFGSNPDKGMHICVMHRQRLVVTLFPILYVICLEDASNRGSLDWQLAAMAILARKLPVSLVGVTS